MIEYGSAEDVPRISKMQGGGESEIKVITYRAGDFRIPGPASELAMIIVEIPNSSKIVELDGGRL